SDPIGEGYITSFARPGKNITGLVSNPEGLAGKRLELLKEVVLGLPRAGLLWEEGTGPYAPSRLGSETEAAGSGLGGQVHPLEGRGQEALETLFEAASVERIEALVVPGSPLCTRRGARVAALALERRWPAVGSRAAQVRDGLLVGYGSPNLAG